MIKDTTPAYLGVSLRNLTTWDDIYNLYRITQGALITDVIEGFAAAKYGIRQNDVIVAINNIKIGNSEDAKNILSTLYAKDKVIIKIYRPSTDKYYNATMTLDADPSYKKTGELQLVVEAQYDNNHPLSYKEWYENGKLKKEGNFNIKGVLDGVQREWEENGNIIRHEIYENDIKITNITGKKPTFFRSGTAYYDDIAMQIANEMGYKIAGFDIVGDGGGKFSIHTILQQAKNTQNGSILIYL